MNGASILAGGEGPGQGKLLLKGRLGPKQLQLRGCKPRRMWLFVKAVCVFVLCWLAALLGCCRRGLSLI